MGRTTRREFVKKGVTAACVAGFGGAMAGELFAAAGSGGERRATGGSENGIGVTGGPRPKLNTTVPNAPLPMKKGLVMDMLPSRLSYAERFKLAKDVGFEVVQAPTTPDMREAEEMNKAAVRAGIRIDSVMNMDHWKYPLSSGDAAAVAKSEEGLQTSLKNAKLWGSDAVLLVPAVVNAQTSYADAWARSQNEIRKLLPMAEELKVVIAIEEVWNKFLLSPLEMVAYIDDFQSPWVKAWFDVGNVVLYGYPQDWIRTLGKSIYKVHLKDFKRKEGGYAWVNLGEGDVDWAAVRKAFGEIGYSGSVIAELDGGDETYLRDVSKRIDRLVIGVS